MRQLIFAIEDDAALQEVYQYSLENEYDCRCFDNGESLFAELAKKNMPDLILLDVMLPGDDGFIILARLKADQSTAHIPVIMVSAKDEEVSKVRGLNMGADDYIAKPFGVLEFIARVKANLRKNNGGPAGSVTYKDIVVDHVRHSITVNGEPIQTTLKEYNLLRLFCENHDKAQEREKIYGEIWDSGFMGETRTLDIHVKELRKKLAEKGSEAVIETIRGVGYILK